MHDDLLAIHDLLKVENEMMDLRKEAADLAARVQKARRRIQKVQAQLQDEQAQLRKLEEEERVLNRRIREHRTKKEKTQGLIDTGRGNYQTAVDQLNALSEIIDRLESELLELIESKERQGVCIERTEELISVAKGRAATATESQRDRRPEVEARFKVLAPLRKARTESLKGHLGQRYADLRARKRPVLVRAVDGSCDFCHMAIAPHVLGEISGGRRVHACRGCGCWFRDAVESEVEDTEEASD
jgi:predicted  nucleic acid-binding Zn-ribbon protein